MSMQMLTIIQFVVTSCCYFLVTILVPAAVLGKVLKKYRLTERLLIYFVVSNFYMMNLVFILQLLHISNRFTLFAGTVIPVGALWLKIHDIKFLALVKNMGQGLKRTIEGKMGIRTALCRTGEWIVYLFKQAVAAVRKVLKGHLWDVLFIAALIAILFYVYGTHAITRFGYAASDMPVHNYWINYLSKNDVFVAGVYPFGFHCIIYYLHIIFRLDTYVVLRVFALIQCMIVHGVLLLVLKGCCKSKYLPYLGVFLYAGADWVKENVYYRYFSALPQEFGMIFVLPAAYFAFRYFALTKEEMGEEPKEKKKEKKERIKGARSFNFKETVKKAIGWLKDRWEKRQGSDWYLLGFAMCFSMTLAIHFYDTMAAGIFCVAIAIGYLTRFIKKKYFVTIVTTCFISIAVAVLPMAIAYATGTPLQNSLYWGMGIISGEDGKIIGPSSGQGSGGASGVMPGTGGLPYESQEGESQMQGAEGAAGQPGLPKESLGEKVSRVAGEIKFAVTDVYDKMVLSIQEIILLKEKSQFAPWVLGLFVALFVEGLLYLVLQKKERGSMFLSVATFGALMSVLQASAKIGVPSLMDANRCGVYYTFMIGLEVSMVVDGMLDLLIGKLKQKWVLSAVSFAVLSLCCFFFWNYGGIRKPILAETLETNGAVACLTNILLEEEDFTWTICSANDELRMAEDHGYHYEISELLKKMEGVGSLGSLYLPTETVYFFVEKKPLDYLVPHEHSGEYISEEGAKQDFPWVTGISLYQGENRWIYMSKMYYWAQAFRKAYPNEMKVYMETDDFICYKLEQNVNHLYNLCIDYGYNNVAQTSVNQ